MLPNGLSPPPNGNMDWNGSLSISCCWPSSCERERKLMPGWLWWQKHDAHRNNVMELLHWILGNWRMMIVPCAWSVLIYRHTTNVHWSTDLLNVTESERSDGTGYCGFYGNYPTKSLLMTTVKAGKHHLEGNRKTQYIDYYPKYV